MPSDERLPVSLLTTTDDAGMCVATHLYVETSSDHLATMQLVNTLRAQSVGAALNARTTALLHVSGIGLPPASAASYVVSVGVPIRIAGRHGCVVLVPVCSKFWRRSR